MKKILAAAALLVTAVAPRGASATSTFSTFMNRALYLAASSSAGYTNSDVTLDPNVAVPTAAGPATISTTGACAFGPFTVSGPPTQIVFGNLDDGAGTACPAGSPASLVFNTAGQNIGAFGFDLGAFGAPNAPVNVSITATFDGTADPSTGSTPPSGTLPQTYSLPVDGTQSFFGLVVNRGIPFPGNASAITSVTVSVTSPGETIAIDDITYGTFVPTVATPEPATLALLGSGLALVGVTARRRRRS